MSVFQIYGEKNRISGDGFNKQHKQTNASLAVSSVRSLSLGRPTIAGLLKKKAGHVEILFQSVARMDSETLYLIATLLRSSGHFNETSTALQKELVRNGELHCNLRKIGHCS